MENSTASTSPVDARVIVTLLLDDVLSGERSTHRVSLPVGSQRGGMLARNRSCLRGVDGATAGEANHTRARRALQGARCENLQHQGNVPLCSAQREGLIALAESCANRMLATSLEPLMSAHSRTRSIVHTRSIRFVLCVGACAPRLPASGSTRRGDVLGGFSRGVELVSGAGGRTAHYVAKYERLLRRPCSALGRCRRSVTGRRSGDTLCVGVGG